jgi:hypothetical protein
MSIPRKPGVRGRRTCDKKDVRNASPGRLQTGDVVNAAKIAAIALHTARLLTREEARRCDALILCSALEIRCSGPPISRFPA